MKVYDMPFQCECGSDDFYTHGNERVVWYVDGNGDTIETGDYIDSSYISDMPYYCSNCEKEYSTIPPEDPETEFIGLKKKHHLAGNNNGCPICDSSSIEGGSFEVSGLRVYQSFFCADCSAEWTDIYKMSDVSIDSYPTDALPESALPPEVPDPNEAFNNSNKDIPF
jgi:hypothetical protein